jgi:hypothetical protein
VPFIQCDSSSVEAVFVGYYMGGQAGKDYIHLSKRGAHDWLCCKQLGWEFTPANAKRVKVEQGELRERMKRVGHGTNFGMRPYMMHMNDPEAFPSLLDAKKAQAFLFASIPALKEFQRECRERAQKEGYLTNAWGLRHYFYDVCTFARDDEGNLEYGDAGHPKVKHGKDSNRSIAFLPQSSNGLFQRDNLLILAVTPVEGEPPSLDAAEVVARWDEFVPAIKAGKTWQRFMPANVSVHDSGCLDTPVSLIDAGIDVLRRVMTRPIPEMGGLTVGAECEVGDDWLDMEKVGNWPML